MSLRVLSNPVDTLSPLTLVLRDEDPMWISPAGNHCTGLNYMDECGRTHFTLLAYRTKHEVTEHEPEHEAEH